MLNSDLKRFYIPPPLDDSVQARLETLLEAFEDVGILDGSFDRDDLVRHITFAARASATRAVTIDLIFKALHDYASGHQYGADGSLIQVEPRPMPGAFVTSLAITPDLRAFADLCAHFALLSHGAIEFDSFISEINLDQSLVGLRFCVNGTHHHWPLDADAPNFEPKLYERLGQFVIDHCPGCDVLSIEYGEDYMVEHESEADVRSAFDFSALLSSETTNQDEESDDEKAHDGDVIVMKIPHHQRDYILRLCKQFDPDDVHFMERVHGLSASQTYGAFL